MENKQILKILMETSTFIKENNYFLFQFGKAFDAQINRFNKSTTGHDKCDLDEEYNVIQLRDMCFVLNENATRVEAAINDIIESLVDADIDAMIEEEICKEMNNKVIEFDKDTHTETPQPSIYCDDTKIEEQRLDGKEEESGIERLLKAIRG